MIRNLFIALALIGFMGSTSAQVSNQNELNVSYEGMWLPLKIKELNYDRMKATGLELSADEVYNESAPSVKDAIVRLDGGSCTAEMISSQGLLLTNHHCGFDAIAALSTPEDDHLTNGFWAMSKAEELPAQGMTASFLVHSEDVTERVKNAGPQMEAVVKEIEETASENGKYEASVEEMFAGGEYYLMVYKTYRDLRLVGTPPNSIGKFGGDTDNWEWPRHTGDFSMFRVYAGADNEPAEYSPENVPYKPKHHLPVSIAGVQDNDYAMIMGYPGSTERYLTAAAVEYAVNYGNPAQRKLMEQKSKIMRKYMAQDDQIRLTMSAGIEPVLTNYYKYYKGQTTMLKRYDVVGLKKKEEAEFQKWAEQDPDRKAKYGDLLSQVASIYEGYAATDLAQTYMVFTAIGSLGTTPMKQALNLFRLRSTMEAEEEGSETYNRALSITEERVNAGFENFFADMEKDVLVADLIAYYEDVPAEMHPEALDQILTHKKTKKGTTPEEKIKMWVDYVYEVSLATSQERATAFFEKPSLKALQNDPLVNLLSSFRDKFINDVAMVKGTNDMQLAQLSGLFIEGLREMHPEKSFYPDANSTMRITFGKVLPYYPRDGVMYTHLTTLDGVMEKEDPNNPEFVVPAKLKELWEQKDYGQYAEDGKMPVCFLTTNDITGGNSGSPVINAKGELIGCAFDGNWEAMAGDVHVFPSLNRTICVDARYVLFIIEKLGGAKHLVEEMDVVGK